MKISVEDCQWICGSLLGRLREPLQRHLRTCSGTSAVLLPSVGLSMGMGGTAKDMCGLKALFRMRVWM